MGIGTLRVFNHDTLGSFARKLYFGSHDPSLQSTLHLFRLLDDKLEAGFVKYPFLRTGEKFASAMSIVGNTR